MRIKNITLKNFKCYENFHIDIYQSNTPFCLCGPNGEGKTTILDAISLITTSFDMYDTERISLALRKYIRNYKNMSVKEQQDSNFLIESTILSDGLEYKISIDKNGYIQDHPKENKERILTTCFRTRYDEELNTFQLKKDKWVIFKKLFESTTGYEVDYEDYEPSVFTDQQSRERMALIDEYVLNLIVKKRNETITDRECSKGEKKVIKNFTTLLNKETIPPIILIDDVEMHVEKDRHLKLIKCIEECFPDSQIIFTTHSPNIILSYDINSICDVSLKNNITIPKWQKSLVNIVKKITYLDSNNDKGNKLIKKLTEDKNCDFQLYKETAKGLLYNYMSDIQKEIDNLTQG